MPTTVVTGGAGFLGSHLCEYLLAPGHRVICVDNLETSSLKNIEHIPTTTSSSSTTTDPAHPDRRAGRLRLPPRCAGEPDRLPAAAAPLAQGRLVRHAQRARPREVKRARFLIASTSEVYGDPLVHPQPETYWGNVNPIGPRGVYDEAKRYAEAMTMAYHRQQGVDTRIVRIFNTYGPRMRPHDGRAIPTFVRQALDGQPITVFGDGSQTRELLLRGRPDPRARAARRVGRAPAGEHRQPDEFTLLELAEAVLRITGSKSEIVFEALPVDDPQERQPDITRAKQILGWEPRSRSRKASGACSRRSGGARRCLGASGISRRRCARRCACRGGGLALERARRTSSSASRRGEHPVRQSRPDVPDSRAAAHAGAARVKLYWGGKTGVPTVASPGASRPTRRIPRIPPTTGGSTTAP